MAVLDSAADEPAGLSSIAEVTAEERLIGTVS